jgi:hypothetical protein
MAKTSNASNSKKKPTNRKQPPARPNQEAISQTPAIDGASVDVAPGRQDTVMEGQLIVYSSLFLLLMFVLKLRQITLLVDQCVLIVASVVNECSWKEPAKSLAKTF